MTKELFFFFFPTREQSADSYFTDTKSFPVVYCIDRTA